MTEVVGTARLGRRTKDLVKRLRPGDLAIIDHVDLDRVSARGARGVRGTRSRQRLAVDIGSLPESRAARARSSPESASSTRRRARTCSTSSPRARRSPCVAASSGATARGSLRASSSPSAPSSERSQTSRVASRRRSRPSRTTRSAICGTRGSSSRTASTSHRCTTRFRDRHAVVVARGPWLQERSPHRSAVHPQLQARPRRGRRWRGRVARHRPQAARDRGRLRLGVRRGTQDRRRAARPRLRRRAGAGLGAAHEARPRLPRPCRRRGSARTSHCSSPTSAVRS